LLKPLIWLLCFPAVWLHRTKITKINCERLKPPLFSRQPQLVLRFQGRHGGAVSVEANYVVAIDGLSGENGCSGTSAGSARGNSPPTPACEADKKGVDKGDVIVIYPEARYSLCAPRRRVPDSLGKMCKLMNVPVVTLITRGHHIDSRSGT
jgi:hypothetical protein